MSRDMLNIHSKVYELIDERYNVSIDDIVDTEEQLDAVWGFLEVYFLLEFET